MDNEYDATDNTDAERLVHIQFNPTDHPADEHDDGENHRVYREEEWGLKCKLAGLPADTIRGRGMGCWCKDALEGEFFVSLFESPEQAAAIKATLTNHINPWVGKPAYFVNEVKDATGSVVKRVVGRVVDCTLSISVV